MKFNYIKSFSRYLKPYKSTVVLSFLTMVAGQVCSLFLPALMADIIDTGVRQRGVRDLNLLEKFSSEAEILQNQTIYIVKIGLIMLLVTLAMIIFAVLTNYLVSRISSNISADIRKDIFEKIMDFSYAQMNKFSVSSLITRTTNDVEHVKDAVLMVTQIIIPPVIMVGGIIMALKKSPSMSWLIAVGSVFSAAVIFVLFKIVFPKIKILQSLTDRFNLLIKERLTGTVIIRIFGNESFEQDRFGNSNAELAGVSLFVGRMMALMSPVLMIFMNIMGIAVIWMGANEIIRSRMNVGDVMAFLEYSVMVISAFLMLSFTFALIPKALVSVERVFEILNEGSQNQKSENSQSLKPDFIETIEFKDVSFKYQGAKGYVLENINFSFKKGERVGLIGTTGSGKSTLIKLMMGFYDDYEGEILVNGTSLKNIKECSLRKAVGYAPQKGILFTGDIASNLKFGNNKANGEELLSAVKAAQIYEFVERNGFDFAISQGGSNLSGGQAQRLGIARAIIKNSSLYIFDDSFSKLDFKTDVNLRKALFERLKDSSVFIVSQRIGTVKNLNKILVLDRGRLVGAGSHEELIKSCGVYNETVKLQVGGGVE